MKIPFARHSYRLDSLPASAQRCVNLYAEQQPEDARTPFSLRATPGLAPFAVCGDGPVRAMAVLGDRALVVSGSSLYSVSSLGAATLIGGVSSGACTIAPGDGYAVVVCEPYAWWTDGVTIGAVNLSAYAGASSVAYVDGWWVLQETGTARWFLLPLRDPTAALDPTDFASAEGNPDKLMRVFVDHRTVWLIGEESTEFWANTGASPFPFERIQGPFMERGTAGGLSVARADNSVFWLGDDFIVYRENSYNPSRISTHAIEAAIRSYAVKSDAIGWSYAQDGHTFYVLDFPTAGTTWVYDCATTLWHERVSGATDTGLWRAASGVAAWGKSLVGDRLSGAIFELTPAVATENGGPLRRIAYSAPMRGADGKRQVMNWLQLDAQKGVGLETGQGSDPQLMLQWSDDGGYTWSNEHWRSAGPIGAYRARARWNRLGQFRERMFRLVVSDPVTTTIYQAEADIVACAS